MWELRQSDLNSVSVVVLSLSTWNIMYEMYWPILNITIHLKYRSPSNV